VSARLSLGDLLALAYIEGLQQRPRIAPSSPELRVRLDAAGRAPIVPLRRSRGDA
jgi:hypothetical protein